MTIETLSEIFSTLRADFQAQTIVNPIDHIHDALSALSWDEMTEFQARYGEYLEHELSSQFRDISRTLDLHLHGDRMPHPLMLALCRHLHVRYNYSAATTARLEEIDEYLTAHTVRHVTAITCSHLMSRKGSDLLKLCARHCARDILHLGISVAGGHTWSSTSLNTLVQTCLDLHGASVQSIAILDGQFPMDNDISRHHTEDAWFTALAAMPALRELTLNTLLSPERLAHVLNCMPKGITHLSLALTNDPTSAQHEAYLDVLRHHAGLEKLTGLRLASEETLRVDLGKLPGIKKLSTFHFCTPRESRSWDEYKPWTLSESDLSHMLIRGESIARVDLNELALGDTVPLTRDMLHLLLYADLSTQTPHVYANLEHLSLHHISCELLDLIIAHLSTCMPRLKTLEINGDTSIAQRLLPDVQRAARPHMMTHTLSLKNLTDAHALSWLLKRTSAVLPKIQHLHLHINGAFCAPQEDILPMDWRGASAWESLTTLDVTDNTPGDCTIFAQIFTAEGASSRELHAPTFPALSTLQWNHQHPFHADQHTTLGGEISDIAPGLNTFKYKFYTYTEGQVEHEEGRANGIAAAKIALMEALVESGALSHISTLDLLGVGEFVDLTQDGMNRLVALIGHPNLPRGCCQYLLSLLLDHARFNDIKHAFKEVLGITLTSARKKSDWRIEAFAHFSLDPSYDLDHGHSNVIDVQTGLKVKPR